MMKQIGVRVSENLLERIDKARGQVKREPWVRMALEAALNQPDVYQEVPPVFEAVSDVAYPAVDRADAFRRATAHKPKAKR